MSALRHAGFLSLCLAAASAQALAEGRAEAPVVVDGGPPLAPLFDYGLRLRAELELELVDVEGPGGFTDRDTSRLKVANRGTYLQIDKFVFSPIFTLNGWLRWVTELRADADGARIDRAYLRTEWLDLASKLSVRAELGRNTPFIRPQRRTEAYPLLGSAFWRGREYHLQAEGRLVAGPLESVLGLSVAQKRPLGRQEVAEDRALRIIASTNDERLVGNNFEGGVKLELSLGGVTLLGYGYLGQLLDNEDTQFLDQSLRDYATLGDRADRTHNLLGSRLSFHRWGFRVAAEAAHAADGLLRRTAWYAQASFDFGVLWRSKWIESIEPVIQVGQLSVDRPNANPDEPESWDRQMVLVGVQVRLAALVTLKVEYYFLGETTGAPSGLRDNTLLAQLALEYDVAIK